MLLRPAPLNAEDSIPVRPVGRLTLSRAVHFSKQLLPSVVRVTGSFRVASLVQPDIKYPGRLVTVRALRSAISSAVHFWNVYVPRLVMLAGNLMLFSAVQLVNACIPMLLRLESSAKVTLSSDAQVWKALSPMDVTDAGISILFNPELPKAFWPMVSNPEGRSREVSAEQLAKASLPMAVTPSGMTMDSSAVQLQKAPFPMLFSPSGRAMPVRAEQNRKA